MSVLYVLVLVALVMVTGAVVAFVWSVRHGQFDDLDTPAVRMLHGDSNDTTPTDDGVTRTSKSALELQSAKRATKPPVLS